MGMLPKLFKQTLTLWSHDGTFSAYGDPAFGNPQEIAGRYEYRTELFITAKGDQSQSRAIAYTTNAVHVDDYLYNGSSSTANPETVSGADQVRRVDGVPDVKNSTTLYKVFL